MAKARRARLDPEARRAQLVETARGLLEQRGVGTMSVEDVADAAGVSRSLVYAYFGDRDGLVAEVYLGVLSELEAALAPCMPGDLPATEACLRKIVERCMRFASEQPAAWRLLVTDSVRRHPAIVRSRSQRVAALAVMGDGESSNHLVADGILGLLEASVLHWLEYSDLTPEEAAGLLSSVLWSGLRGVDPV
ncbi:MAG TPA: TetR/AcrR family transcriptional regulator [Acidimicrobiales bacterium]|nr:TetR/AcrR family transcriptional regulator [Acidimicrobiales bacterium]